MPQIVNIAIQTAILGQFLRFCVVGVVGFVADAGSLQLLVKWSDMGLYSGRIISYLIAASITWALNRRYTFQVKTNNTKGKEWSVYVVANGFGAMVNYGCYALTVSLFALTQEMPVIGVAIGSIAGLGFNFITNRYYVFREK